MKVAVFLRGHKRVWEYTKQNILEFCNGLADEVHYYVAVWESKDYDVSSIQNDFPSDKLKGFIVEPNDYQYGAFTGPAHLSSELSSFRLIEEMKSKVNYDFILDTRFDVKFKKLQDIDRLGNMTLGSTIVDRPTNYGYVEMEDHCYVTDRLTHTIWNSRLSQHKNQSLGGHAWLTEYAKSYGISTFNIPWFKCYIIRPHIARMDVEELSSNYYTFDGPWHTMTDQEKIQIINELGCSPTEYVNQLSRS